MKKFLFAFATMCLVGLWSCQMDEFDDSIINDRLDNLEERVENIESKLSEIQNDLKTLDEISALLSGAGYVSNVEDNGNGITVTISYYDKTKKDEVFTIKNGADGADGTNGVDGVNGTNGTNGADGDTVGVEYDKEEGRWYWTLNGQPLTDDDGNKLWTSGKDGKDGQDGQNGQNGKDGKDGQDGQNGQDGQDGKDADPAQLPEYKLSYLDSNTRPTDDPAKSYDGSIYLLVKDTEGASYTGWLVVSKLPSLLLSAEYENGVLTITQGNKEYSFDVATNKLALTFTVDEEEVAEHGTLEVVYGDKTIIEVAVEGASEYYVVKAEMLNDSDYTVKVNADNNIEITAAEDAEDDKLLIEILDGVNCYHTWIAVTAVASKLVPEPEEPKAYVYNLVELGADMFETDGVYIIAQKSADGNLYLMNTTAGATNAGVAANETGLKYDSEANTLRGVGDNYAVKAVNPNTSGQYLLASVTSPNLYLSLGDKDDAATFTESTEYPFYYSGSFYGYPDTIGSSIVGWTNRFLPLLYNKDSWVLTMGSPTSTTLQVFVQGEEIAAPGPGTDPDEEVVPEGTYYELCTEFKDGGEYIIAAEVDGELYLLGTTYETSSSSADYSGKALSESGLTLSSKGNYLSGDNTDNYASTAKAASATPAGAMSPTNGYELISKTDSRGYFAVNSYGVWFNAKYYIVYIDSAYENTLSIIGAWQPVMQLVFVDGKWNATKNLPNANVADTHIKIFEKHE